MAFLKEYKKCSYPEILSDKKVYLFLYSKLCLIMTDFITYNLIIIIALILAYVFLYYSTEFIITKELQKKKTKRISNAKTYKTVTRRGESFEYEFPLNPNLDGFWIRLFAKILDYGVYLCVFYLIESFLTKISIYPFLLAFLGLFLLNPIFEYLTGRTFGKLICGLRVVDDFGENPSFLTSLIKNLLQLLSIFFYVLSSATILEKEMFFHNKRTYTYTIWNKDKEKILTELNN